MECTNWMLSAWNSILDWNDVPSAWLLWSGPSACGQLRTSCLPSPTPPLPSSPPTHPPLVTLRKNHLKRLKIKQGTTSKVNSILFNRLLSPVLLNKSGLVQAKVGNFNLKFLNRCFSNYYQVQTRPVFAETVTYILS